MSHIPYCAFVDGEPAYCTFHAAELLGVPKHKLHSLARVGKNRPEPVFEPRDHVDAERLGPCELKWKGRCLWVLGDVMAYQDTHSAI